MEPFSFVHVADLHLGYAQYNLEARREDFTAAFREVVDRTLELKPDFMVVAGDLFQQARPSNATLEAAITQFIRLRDAGVPVLAVDGSHDRAPNLITGTILHPLDSSGLLRYLPRHPGACWRSENCYVYGVPSFRTPRGTEEGLPAFLEENRPTPDPSLFNVFVFHMALDIPDIPKPPQMEAEARPELLPEGFQYYAGGHIHRPYQMDFKGGLLAYSGCTETVDHGDAATEKGFYHVKVDGKGAPTVHRVTLRSPRRFIVLDHDYTGSTPAEIAEGAARLVREADEEGAVIVPVLRGVLPAEASRGEVDLAKIRDAAERALLVHPVLRLRETEVSEEVVRSIFEGGLKDLRAKAFEYFLEIFSQRYPKEEAERVARLAVDLIGPLTAGQEARVKELVEGALP